MWTAIQWSSQVLTRRDANEQSQPIAGTIIRSSEHLEVGEQWQSGRNQERTKEWVNTNIWSDKGKEKREEKEKNKTIGKEEK